MILTSQSFTYCNPLTFDLPIEGGVVKVCQFNVHLSKQCLLLIGRLILKM